MRLLSTNIVVQVTGGEEKTLGTGSGTAIAKFPGTGAVATKTVTLTDGTGANKAQKVGLTSGSASGGASVTIDLQACPGPYGNVNFTSVKSWGVINLSTTAADIFEVGDAASNAWTNAFAGTNARIKVGPGHPLTSGDPVNGIAVAGANKNVKIANVGAGTTAASFVFWAVGEGS